ncbi:hypothetical protein I317_01229 [Kwoniella heveanensis CBS 569]|nr:hypothetical protein I317_01229 [Kwoniella heveanensis CBS 569]
MSATPAKRALPTGAGGVPDSPKPTTISTPDGGSMVVSPSSPEYLRYVLSTQSSKRSRTRPRTSTRTRSSNSNSNTRRSRQESLMAASQMADSDSDLDMDMDLDLDMYMELEDLYGYGGHYSRSRSLLGGNHDNAEGELDERDMVQVWERDFELPSPDNELKPEAKPSQNKKNQITQSNTGASGPGAGSAINMHPSQGGSKGSSIPSADSINNIQGGKEGGISHSQLQSQSQAPTSSKLSGRSILDHDDDAPLENLGDGIGIGDTTGWKEGMKIVGVGHQADSLPLTNSRRMQLGLPLKPPPMAMLVRPSSNSESGSASASATAGSQEGRGDGIASTLAHRQVDNNNNNDNDDDEAKRTPTPMSSVLVP